jgi:hypothetical protein
MQYETIRPIDTKFGENGPLVVSYLVHLYLTPLFSHESHLGEVYLIQHYVIKFISDLRQVPDFLRVLRFPSPIKLIATI